MSEFLIRMLFPHPLLRVGGMLACALIFIYVCVVTPRYDYARMVKLREEGHSLREVADAVGCCQSIVSRATAQVEPLHVREARRVYELLSKRPYEDKELPRK